MSLLFVLVVLNIILPCQGTDLNFSISGNISEAIGTNGSELVCTFLKPTDGDFFAGVSFSNQTNIVATFSKDQQPRLTNNGHYLTGRVLLKRLNNLLGSDYYQAKMIFTNLLCVDEGEYWCQVVWLNYDIGQTKTRWSSSTTVNTIAPPSRPGHLSFYDSNLDEDISTSIPTTTETQNATSTYNNLKTKMLFNSMQSTGDNKESIEDILQTGDLLTISCSGNVGRPPEPLLVQKVRKGGDLLNTTALVNATEDTRENCSYVYNSTFTTELTYKDHGAVFRCGVISYIFEKDMYIETDPIDVKYPVHKPSIAKSESQPAESSVELFCISDGNPPPSYQWYKQDNGVLVPRESAQNITIHNVTERQIYVCKVNNTIGGVLYSHETSIVLEGQGATQSFTWISSSTEKSSTIVNTAAHSVNANSNDSGNNNTAITVLGIVCGILTIIIICITVLYLLLRKRLRSLESNNQLSTSDQYDSVSNDRTAHQYDDLRRQEHEYNNTTFSMHNT